jgi:hypothetical protein
MPAAASGTDRVYGKKFSLGRAWGLSLLSFGFWGFYWFHTTRKQVDSELGGQRDDATLHTLGLLVPVLNFFVIYWLWRDISELRGRAGLERFPEVGYVVGAIFLAPVFYSIVLSKLNEYWDRRAGGVAPSAPSTGGEKALVAVGALFWVLWLVIIVLVILAAAATTAVSY